MKRMGRYSPPVDGVPVANGHAPSLAPFAISPLQVRQGGPVTPWPQPAEPGRWQRATSAMHSAASVMAEHRGWLAAVPVVLVNAVAFGAQLGFWRAHVPAAAEAVLVALALESIAIYLAWQAHLAQIADDSALRLRLAAYGMALVIGALNYSHFMAPGWRPTVEAVTFGMMSAISPWLWSVHSRRQSRDALKAKGLIEPHAVRLGATRWTWHPVRAWRVMFRATWQGENDPVKAVALPAMKTSAVARDDDSDTPLPPPDDDTDDDKDVPPDDDKKDDTPPPPPPPKDRRKHPTGRDKALAIMKRNPGLTDAEVAKRAGVSVRTVQRARPPKGQE